MMFTIPTDSEPNNYPVYIGTDIFNKIGELCSHKALLVADATIMPLFADRISKAFAHPVDIVTINTGEINKTWRSVEQILNALTQHRYDRGATLISLGGGMISDITGFAAAIYQRGINWLAMPTTLVSQVDAAIGGKTGCNFGGVKNQIGCVYQPKSVIIDCAALDSLPDREYLAGIAEVVKYGVIKDAKLFAWLERNVQQILQRDKAVLQTMIHTCCMIKREIVAQDVRDHGIRMILNFGHTFAHALEAATKFNTLLHGEAVALGMLMATNLAERLEIAYVGLYDRLYRLLISFGLPVEIGALPCSVSTICEFMLRDKKVYNKQLTLVLPLTLGEVRVVKDFDLELVEDLIEDYVSV